MSPQTIVVSGSSGLIGSALVSRLAGAGHHVRRLVRRQAGTGEIRWDPIAGELPAAELEGVDAVVHLAGAGIGDKRWTAARKAELVESRTKSTGLLARTLAALDRPPSRAVEWLGDRHLRSPRRRGSSTSRRRRERVSWPTCAERGRGPRSRRPRLASPSLTCAPESSSAPPAGRWPGSCHCSSSASADDSAPAVNGRAGSASTTRWGRSSTSSPPGSSAQSTSRPRSR